MKKLGRILSLAVVASLIAVAIFALSACNGSDDTTTAQTPPTTQLPEYMEAMNFEQVSVKKLGGIRPYSIKSDDPWVASANIMHNRNSISLVAYHVGETDITVSDCFGFTSKLHVKIKEDYSFEYSVVSNQADEFFEVQTDAGISVNKNEDVTAAVQAIIDNASEGDTIYFYPGKYKISSITMREGVHLRLATTVDDVTAGFTDEVATDLYSGNDIAVIENIVIMNNDRGERGAEGSSNFSIVGGAFLNNVSLVFTCADNLLFEDIIIKDLTDRHAFQITGCTNVTMKDLMFTGYTYKSTFPRELIQVEHSHPGATGDASNAPLTFENGEFYRNENVTIEGCYFGKSDKMDPPVIAIGHHGYSGYATVSGFYVKDNVFDGCKHSAIRYCNIVDTEITGNTFIALAEYQTVNHSDAKRPAFIVIWDAGDSMHTYRHKTGSTVTIPTYQSGTRNLLIENNTFDIEAGSDKRIFDASMSNSAIGAKFVSGIYVADSFDSRPSAFSGYVDYLNSLVDASFINNTINFAGQPTYSSMFFNTSMTVGLVVEGNEVNLADGVSFTMSTDGMEGFSIKNNRSGAEAYTRYINMAKSTNRYVAFLGADGEELFRAAASTSVLLTLESDGNGSIRTHCEDGNVFVTVTPNEGYDFVGWQKGGSDVSGGLTVTAATTLTAVFAAK